MTISRSNEAVGQRFAALQLTHLELRVDEKKYFKTEREAVDLILETGMHKETQETFWCLAYGPLLNVATLFEVNRGMYAYVDLHMPSLMGGVLASGAERFWLAHNHPSLSAQPSPADIHLTQEVMAAANTLKLHFEDHVILVPDGSYFSFARAGLLVPDPDSIYMSNGIGVPAKA